MAKRRRRSADPAKSARSRVRQNRVGIIQTSIYLPSAMHDALRAAAFKERCKVHDIMLEGIALALEKRNRRAR